MYGKSFIKLSGVLYRILLRNILTASSWGNHRPCWNLKHVRTEKINRGVAINGVVDRARRRESLSETLLSVRSNAKKKTFRCRTCQKDPYLGQKCLCWIQEGKVDIKSALSVAEFTVGAQVKFSYFLPISILRAVFGLYPVRRECFVLITGRWLQGPLHLHMPFAVHRSRHLHFINLSIKLVMDVWIKDILVNQRENCLVMTTTFWH